MPDRAGYIEAYALYLNDKGECPRRSDFGLTFEEGLKCERPALDRAYELQTALVDLDCTCPPDGSVCFEDTCDLCSMLDGEDHCCKCPCEFCREDAFNV